MLTMPPETENPPEVSYDDLLQAVHDVWWLMADMAAAGVPLRKHIMNDPRWHAIKNLYPQVTTLLRLRGVRDYS